MNCFGCRKRLVAFVEGLLDREKFIQAQAHLGTCAACRTEYEAVARLQRRLAAMGRISTLPHRWPGGFDGGSPALN